MICSRYAGAVTELECSVSGSDSGSAHFRVRPPECFR